MKKELAESLRHMQSHPTTGTPHNQQVISTQVETIFVIDELKEEIIKLNKTIESNEAQNQQLEKSNINLQRAMLILTLITTSIAAFPILLFIAINYIGPLFSNLFNIKTIPTILLSTISGIFSLIIGILTSKYGKNLFDVIKITDKVDIIVRDKEGNIKEARHV